MDKDDFNRTLRSVEANTVRLQEYGRDVLVLEKEDTEKYSVVSGTPEKMVEHLMDIASKDDDTGKGWCSVGTVEQWGSGGHP